MTTDTPDWATSRATELFKRMLDEPMSNGVEMVAEALREAQMDNHSEDYSEAFEAFWTTEIRVGVAVPQYKVDQEKQMLRMAWDRGYNAGIRDTAVEGDPALAACFGDGSGQLSSDWCVAHRRSVWQCVAALGANK